VGYNFDGKPFRIPISERRSRGEKRWLRDDAGIGERIERHQLVRQPKKAAKQLSLCPRGINLPQSHAEGTNFAQPAAHGVALSADFTAAVLDLIVSHTET
jgi:hypothetical protein